MKYILNARNIWEKGPREKQEDSIFPELNKITADDRLFIVCDGMGGHSAGEVASQTVCFAISEYIMKNCPETEGGFTDDDFNSALDYAYKELDAKDNGDVKKMGTTLTFLKFHDKGATIAHIGDSRVYHVRPGKELEDTEILFQTRDHSLINDLIEAEAMTPEEAKHSKQKNVITRAIQPNMERPAKADIYHTHDIKPGDYFMLCSDGIIEFIEDDNIRFIFSEQGGNIAKKIMFLLSNQKQLRDNHSAIIIQVIDVTEPIPTNEIISVIDTDEREAEIVGEIENNNKTENISSKQEDVDVPSCPKNIEDNDNYIIDGSTTSLHNKLYKIIIYVCISLLIILGVYSLYKKFSDKTGPNNSDTEQIIKDHINSQILIVPNKEKENCDTITHQKNNKDSIPISNNIILQQHHLIN